MPPASRIDACFDRLKLGNQAGLVAYVTAGDPSMAATVELAIALEDAGADILELGVPFSDPLADGAVNQAAAQRALEAGATLGKLLETVAELRGRVQMPLVLFTYLNPIYTYGFDGFHADAAAAGVDGILILDLPPDEAARNAELAGRHALQPIRLIAPATPDARIAQICASADGFIYCVSREGVTGEQSSVSSAIGGRVADIRRHTDLPVAVGFGISTPEQAAEVAREADAVVVGSAIVRRIAEHGSQPGLAAKIADFVRPLAAAVKEARTGQ